MAVVRFPGNVPGNLSGQARPNQPRPNVDGNPGQFNPPNLPPEPGDGGGFNRPGGGMLNFGQTGPLRLVTGSLSKEASWLLPVALFGLLVLVVIGKITWPLDAQAAGSHFVGRLGADRGGVL